MRAPNRAALASTIAVLATIVALALALALALAAANTFRDGDLTDRHTRSGARGVWRCGDLVAHM